MDDRPKEEPVEVPHTKLSAPALRGLVEELVTREGTDYGFKEKTLEEKVADVLRRLERGEAKIVFDLESEKANIVPAK